MSKLFNSLSGDFLNGGTRAAAGAERRAVRDAPFVDRHAPGAGPNGRAVGNAREPGAHAPGGGPGQIDLANAGRDANEPGFLGRLMRGLGGGAAEAGAEAGGASLLSRLAGPAVKLGLAYFALVEARQYASELMFGKHAMAVQSAAEGGNPPPAPGVAGAGLAGGATALPDGSAVGPGGQVIRHASMTPEAAGQVRNVDRRFAVGMAAVGMTPGSGPSGSTVSSVVGPLADGGSFFMLNEMAPGGGPANRSFAATVGPEGSALSATHTRPLPNGVMERTAVEHGSSELAALAPVGPLDRSARVTMGPDASAASDRLRSSLREPDSISPMLGASSLHDMKAHAIQAGGTDRRSDVVFSGKDKDGKPVTGGMSFAEGSARVTLFGEDGKTPVWSKDLDGAGVSMTPSGVPVLSGKSAEQAGQFTKSPAAFKAADDRERAASRSSEHGPGTPSAGRDVPSAAGAGREPAAAGGAAATGERIRFADWDRQPSGGMGVSSGRHAGPSASEAPLLGGDSSRGGAGRFAGPDRGLDAANPLQRWAELGAGRDQPVPGLSAGRSGPALGAGTGLGR